MYAVKCHILLEQMIKYILFMYFFKGSSFGIIFDEGGISHSQIFLLLFSLIPKVSSPLSFLLTKSCTGIFGLVKAMIFPVVMYGCESWTVKKPECRRIDVFELWCWRRFLRVPWTARRSNQSFLKEISPEYSLEGLMLKLNFNTLAT